MTGNHTVTAWPGLGTAPAQSCPLLGATTCNTARETTSTATFPTFLTD